MSQLQQPEAALVYYEHVLRLDPEHRYALKNRATAFQQLGQWGSALAAFERLLQLTPDNAYASAQALHLRQNLCLWDGFAARCTALRTRLAQQSEGDGSARVAPFGFLALAASAAEQQHCARLWAQQALRIDRSAARFTFSERRQPGRRLRVGYLSADLREHATAYLMAAVFEAHQQHGIDCYAYSYGVDDASPMQQRLQGAFHRFTPIRALSDYAAAEQIHADEIDILIDLKGYTSDERSAILAYRAAPLQVQFLGYPGTMGSTLIDYLIADRFIIPPEHLAYYDEKIVQLPHCYQPNDPQRVIGPAPSRSQAGLPDTGFVFCCFNQSYKITPEIFDQWMRLLQAVPESVLWLLSATPASSANLRREAQARGVDGARLIFAAPLPLAAHLGRLTLADLFLDTPHYNAHTSASDALWVGVPLLTCPGQTFAARVAGSLLHTLGLDELIAASAQQYEDIAYTLATQPERLAALRHKLAAARASSALFDAERFAANLIRAYQAMWQRYQAGQSAAHLTLPPVS